MADWEEHLMKAKYHLSVARRLFNNYYNFEEKRFLIGMINEMVLAVTQLSKAFLNLEGVSEGSFNYFLRRIAPKYIKNSVLKDLSSVLEIERAQRNSPVEYAKDDKIILLIRGEYKFLTAGRLKELLKSISDAVKLFPRSFRQL